MSQGYERTTAEDFADIKPLPDATPEEADEWAKLREILMRYMDPKTGSIQANLVSVAVGLQMGLEYCGFEIRQDTFGTSARSPANSCPMRSSTPQTKTPSTR